MKAGTAKVTESAIVWPQDILIPGLHIELLPTLQNPPQIQALENLPQILQKM